MIISARGQTPSGARIRVSFFVGERLHAENWVRRAARIFCRAGGSAFLVRASLVLGKTQRRLDDQTLLLRDKKSAKSGSSICC